MKPKKEMMEVTPEERELLERMRNYNRSYPNGYPQLLWDLQNGPTAIRIKLKTSPLRGRGTIKVKLKYSNNGNNDDNPSSSY